ncbi:glycerol-3-phosphate 1-O-acyltransferase PlsY [candidate division KSB1 bacterium]
MISIILIAVLSYLLGSIPNSIIFGKILKGIDIRQHGSGNAGATNVFRLLGWKAGIAVGILDLAKGFIPTVFFSQIVVDEIIITHDWVQLIAGMSAVFGHIWTIFAGFKGGKGALTALGMFFGLMPGTAAVCFLVFISVFAVSRIVSLGTLTTAVLLSIIMIVRKFFLGHTIENSILILSGVITLLVIITHISNIKRLINGTENKFKK